MYMYVYKGFSVLQCMGIRRQYLYIYLCKGDYVLQLETITYM